MQKVFRAGQREELRQFKMKDQTKPGLQEPVDGLKEERKQTEVVKPAKTSPGTSSSNACPSVSEMGWGDCGGKAVGHIKVHGWPVTVATPAPSKSCETWASLKIGEPQPGRSPSASPCSTAVADTLTGGDTDRPSPQAGGRLEASVWKGWGRLRRLPRLPARRWAMGCGARRGRAGTSALPGTWDPAPFGMGLRHQKPWRRRLEGTSAAGR